ncbi:hypothetical protein [Microvirga calopogonii]|uniref:hypothetical protein n=1 Tax=Microvirga calopogonii TaxID=2078013 RepID=UPI0013B445BE|nr:hypothetical protein [Microvirga calopogonii]
MDNTHLARIRDNAAKMLQLATETLRLLDAQNGQDSGPPPMPAELRSVPGDNSSALTPEADEWLFASFDYGMSDNALHKMTGITKESLRKKRRYWRVARGME